MLGAEISWWMTDRLRAKLARTPWSCSPMASMPMPSRLKLSIRVNTVPCFSWWSKQTDKGSETGPDPPLVDGGGGGVWGPGWKWGLFLSATWSGFILSPNPLSEFWIQLWMCFTHNHTPFNEWMNPVCPCPHPHPPSPTPKCNNYRCHQSSNETMKVIPWK